MPADASKTCPKCGDSLIEGKPFCAGCGLAIVAVPERVAIDAYVSARVDEAARAKMADQTTLVRQIANDAEDVVMARIKRYGWLAAVAVFLLGLYGWGSIKSIVSDAKARIEPLIKTTEDRVNAVQGQVKDAGNKVTAVTNQLNKTAELADKQSARITAQGGEIGKKLEDVQKAADRANHLSDGFLQQANRFEKELTEMRQRAEAQTHKLEETQKTFDTKIAQITQHVDNVSVEQSYPSLGQKEYATYNGRPWKGVAGKQSSDKWVNIYVDPTAVGKPEFRNSS